MRLVLLIYFVLLGLGVFSQNNLTWKLFHPIKKVWIDAGTNQTVQEVLIAAGELPDPFIGENEAKFTWIENYTWEFESEFQCSPEDFNFQFLEMYFPTLDTYAAIYINDSLVKITANAFIPHSVQLKSFVKIGLNKVKIVFTPPVLYHKKNYANREVTYPAPNDNGEIAVAPLTRKPQYQFGWDWALRMNTIGFRKPIAIRKYDTNRIVWAKVETKEIKEKEAVLTVNLKFADKEFMNNSVIFIQSELFYQDFALRVNNGEAFDTVILKNPKLWWPRGQGEPYLYQDTWRVLNVEGWFIDSVKVEFGVRTSELIQEKDSVGTSYYFKINGRPIFCKGANYIPQDVFPARVTDESIRTMVQQMKEANFNIVRVWGGGYYPDEVFYEECDRQGIMVWQDVMFACAMYPGDSSFLENVREELSYQIPRIAAHPSVIQFNGNNEVDVAWKYWGFRPKYQITNKQQAIIEESYDALFKKLIPSIVAKNSNIPYIHTSPLSHWTQLEDFPHGTQHYWGVWHGKDPIEDFGKKSGRFNAEYGFQSFPEYSTLMKFSQKSDWELNSTVMKNHQKSYVGNGMIKKHSDLLFGKTDDFEEFVYFSQLTQAKAVSIAISAHRLNAPTCMGTIYWQLNDCWPAPTWSSIDYYGNWKALHYRVREDYQDVTVLQKTEKIGGEEYYFVSDSPTEFETELTCEIYATSGVLLKKETNKIQVKSGFKTKIEVLGEHNKWLDKNYIVKFIWKNELHEVIERSFTHIIDKLTVQKATEKDFSWKLVQVDSVKKKVVIEIHTSKLLQDLWFSSMKLGVKFNRNFINVLPGTHTIEVNFQDEIPQKEDFKVHWR